MATFKPTEQEGLVLFEWKHLPLYKTGGGGDVYGVTQSNPPSDKKAFMKVNA